MKKPEGMASRNDATIYRIQGANAQEICPMAFDCEGTSAYPIPKEVLANIQKGVKSTGRASTFVRASGHISNVVNCLYKVGLSEVVKNDLFADVKPDSTCLGYVAFMFMPLETCINIVRNQEKGVLSDWCCMYCFAGSADITVDGKGFLSSEEKCTYILPRGTCIQLQVWVKEKSFMQLHCTAITSIRSLQKWTRQLGAPRCSAAKS